MQPLKHASTLALPAAIASAPTLTVAASWALNMANQLGYMSRDMIKVQTADHDRKADFLMRNFVPSLIYPLLMESTFRTVDTVYSIPLLTKTLGLQDLGISEMPTELRRRCIGNMVKKHSVFVIPRVLEEMDIRKKACGEEHNRMRRLIRHLQQKLNFVDYLDSQIKEGHLTRTEADQVREHTQKLLEELNLPKLSITPDVKAIEQKLARLSREVWGQHPEKQKLLDYVRIGVDSSFIRNMVKRIQTSSKWPKLGLFAVMTFLVYGLAITYADNYIVQPWQDRLVAKRGTAKEVVAPCYWSVIPWAMVLIGGLWDKVAPKFVRKMSYLGRFVAVSAAALTSYFVSAGLLIRNKLSKPPSQEMITKQNTATRQAAQTQYAIASYQPVTPSFQPVFPSFQSASPSSQPIVPPFQSVLPSPQMAIATSPSQKYFTSPKGWPVPAPQSHQTPTWVQNRQPALAASSFASGVSTPPSTTQTAHYTPYAIPVVTTH